MATALGCLFPSSSDLSCSVCEGSWREESLRRRGALGREGQGENDMYESSIVVTMATALGCLFPSSSDLSCSVCKGIWREESLRRRGYWGGRGKEKTVCMSLSGYYGNSTGLSVFFQRRLELLSL